MLIASKDPEGELDMAYDYTRFLSVEIEEGKLESAEKNLIAALLIRTIHDCLDTRKRGGAVKWVKSSRVYHPQCLTFIYCCETLEVCPKRLRRQILGLVDWAVENWDTKRGKRSIKKTKDIPLPMPESTFSLS